MTTFKRAYRGGYFINQIKYNVHWWIFNHIVKNNRFFKEQFQFLKREEVWDLLEALGKRSFNETKEISEKKDKISRYLFKLVPFL